MRRHTKRSTIIYWLFDTRPDERLRQHRVSARRFPNRPVSLRIDECGTHIRIKVMETVPGDNDRDIQERSWIDREKFWVRTLRLLHEDAANVADGGQGALGSTHSIATREKMRAARIGRKREPFSVECIAKMSAAKLGKRFSIEHRQRISAALTGRAVSDEARAKMSASARNRRIKENANASR